MSAAAIQGVNLLDVRYLRRCLKVVIKDVAKRAAAKQTKWFPFVGQAVSASISYYFMSKLGKIILINVKKLSITYRSVIIVSRCKIYMLKRF